MKRAELVELAKKMGIPHSRLKKAELEAKIQEHPDYASLARAELDAEVEAAVADSDPTTPVAEPEPPKPKRGRKPKAKSPEPEPPKPEYKPSPKRRTRRKPEDQEPTPTVRERKQSPWTAFLKSYMTEHKCGLVEASSKKDEYMKFKENISK